MKFNFKYLHPLNITYHIYEVISDIIQKVSDLHFLICLHMNIRNHWTLKTFNSTHYKAVYSSLGYTFYSNTYNKNCLPYHNTCEVHYEWVRSGMFVSWWNRCHHICRNHQRIILWVCLAKHVIHYNSQPKVYEYNKHLIWN